VDRVRGDGARSRRGGGGEGGVCGHVGHGRCQENIFLYLFSFY
jgi:hypothetical protein